MQSAKPNLLVLQCTALLDPFLEMFKHEVLYSYDVGVYFKPYEQTNHINTHTTFGLLLNKTNKTDRQKKTLEESVKGSEKEKRKREPKERERVEKNW